MSSTSPESTADLVIDRTRPIPGTWLLCAGLLGTHALTAWMYAAQARVPLWMALFGDRGLRLRVTVGGQYRPLVEDGQGWRLMRSVFLHADGLHLVLNVLAIAVIGRLLEPWVGGIRQTFWFVVAGAGASVASHQAGLLQSDGASGGAFGLFAAVLVLAWRQRDRLDPRDRPILLRWMPLLLVGNLVLSFVIPAIDGIAHTAGLLIGTGLAFATSMTPPPTWRTVVEAAVVVLAIGIAVLRI